MQLVERDDGQPVVQVQRRRAREPRLAALRKRAGVAARVHGLRPGLTYDAGDLDGGVAVPHDERRSPLAERMVEVSQ